MDARGRVGRIANLSGGSPTNYATNTYDLADRLVERLFGNGTKLVREYDDANRVTRDAHFLPPVGGNPAVAFEDRTYGRDAVGNRTWMSNAVKPDFSEWYGYDNYDRLRDFKRGTLNTEKTDVTAYTSNVHVTQRQQWSGMDVLGNWLTTLTTQAGVTTTDARTHNDANEILTRDLSTSGSPSGSPITFAHDHNGNMTNDGQFLYDYDAENRITRARRILPGSPPTSQVVGEYYYDAIGRRVRKVVSNCGEVFDGDFVWIWNPRWQLLQTRTTIATAESIFREHVCAGPSEYVDSTIADVGTPSGNVFYANDHLYSTVATTSNSAEILSRNCYRSYGLQSVLSPDYSIPPNPQSLQAGRAFQGLLQDAETLTGHARRRQLTPQLGRFNARDPKTYVDGPNMNEALASNPVRYFDPFGQDIWIEGASGEEKELHRSINVGDPNGEYDSFSFGADSTGSYLKFWKDNGGVYVDGEHGGRISPDRYIKTDAETDRRIAQVFRRMVGERGRYGFCFGVNCRSWTEIQWEWVKRAGKPAPPPCRPIEWKRVAKLGLTTSSTTSSTTSAVVAPPSCSPAIIP